MFAAPLLRWGYARIAKPFFFRRDPELVHERMVRAGEALGRHAWSRKLTRRMFRYEHPSLRQEICGIRFTNPVGLTAGFDKNARLTRIMPDVGFGFMEIGSVTGEPCAGNPGRHLWRLPKSRGLVVHYGLKNDGAEIIAARIANERFGFPVGVNIAKTNRASISGIEASVADYAKSFRIFLDIGHYYTVNISCPNTHDGENFQDPTNLEHLLSALDAIHTEKPVFLKISADLPEETLDRLMDVAARHRVRGFVISNLTKTRANPVIRNDELASDMRGGISGRAVFEPSNRLLGHAFQKAGGRFVLIGVGGIFSAEDAYEKIRLGASLVELATGMIFTGPQLIGEINRGLARLLRRDGFHSISDAVGSAWRQA